MFLAFLKTLLEHLPLLQAHAMGWSTDEAGRFRPARQHRPALTIPD